MQETHQESRTETEVPTFELNQEVTIQELRAVIAPQNTLDSVEETRLRMVGSHVNELLRSDLPSDEAGVHKASLYHLGAEAVLEYLPVSETAQL